MKDLFNIQKNPMSCDILVIGCGLAGITAAFRAADSGAEVMLVTETRLASGSSFYPLMDTIHCQCTIDQADESVFMDDINSCSAGMNDPWMNHYYIQNIRSCIQYFADLGVQVQKLPEPKLPCFGHHAHDLYEWNNWDQIRKILSQRVEKQKNLHLIEQSMLISLIRDNDRICGACFYRKSQNLYEAVFSHAVILATGGFGALYRHNLNTNDVCGVGQALALINGASLVNLEFNQFIPGFISPGYKIIFREGSLEYCDGLYDANNRNILRDYFASEEDMDICLQHRAAHGPFTTADDTLAFDQALFDASLSVPDNGVRISYRNEILTDERSYMSNYIRWLKKEFGIDIAHDTIKIAPFFHAANGGIYVDHKCESSLHGLFACGECAGGIHGADRLGGNASGSCLVFGSLAANSALEYTNHTIGEDLSSVSSAEEQLYDTYRDGSLPDLSLKPSDVLGKVQDLLWHYGNVRRDQEGLNKALSAIEVLKDSYAPLQLLATKADCNPSEVFHASLSLTLSEALLTAMSARKESRGGHYRRDFPDLNHAFDKRIFITKDKNGIPCNSD